jgi:hypothetical protein
MLFFVILYRISPLVVIVPLFAVAIILHFYFYSSAQASRLKRRQIFPEAEKRFNRTVAEAAGTSPSAEEHEITEQSFAPSPSPRSQSQLTSRKASMAQGEAIGIRMIQQLRQQQQLSSPVPEEVAQDGGNSSSDSDFSGDSLVIVRAVRSNSPLPAPLQIIERDDPVGASLGGGAVKWSSSEDEKIEEIVWLSDDDDDEMPWDL